MRAMHGHLRPPPPPASLRVELRGGDGGPLHATVSGEIDYADAFSMQVRISAACRRRRARGLIVDLADVHFMSSSGLAALLSLQRERACVRGGLALARPSREVRALLRRTGLDRRLTVVDTAAQAEVLLHCMATGRGAHTGRCCGHH
jgi:anti-sigma B factor antagonist